MGEATWRYKKRIRARRYSDPPSQADPGKNRETHSLAHIIVMAMRYS